MRTPRPPQNLVLEELYAVMQFFRSLGFPADNLYVRNNCIDGMGAYKGQACVAIELRWMDKTFRYTIAPVKDERTFLAKWQAFAEDANAGRVDSAELKRMVDKSLCWRDPERVIAALIAKDITPPLGVD